MADSYDEPSIYIKGPKILQNSRRHIEEQKTLRAAEQNLVVRGYLTPGLISYDGIYLLTAIGLTPGGSSTVYIYTQTIHRTTQWNTIPRMEHT